jgi:hypothetical protein
MTHISHIGAYLDRLEEEIKSIDSMDISENAKKSMLINFAEIIVDNNKKIIEFNNNLIERLEE